METVVNIFYQIKNTQIWEEEHETVKYIILSSLLMGILYRLGLQCSRHISILLESLLCETSFEKKWQDLSGKTFYNYTILCLSEFDWQIVWIISTVNYGSGEIRKGNYTQNKIKNKLPSFALREYSFKAASTYPVYILFSA